MVRLFGWPEVVAEEPSRSRGGEWKDCRGQGICFVVCRAIWLWDLTGFTLPCVKQLASGKLLYNAESPTQPCTYMCGSFGCTHIWLIHVGWQKPA